MSDDKKDAELWRKFLTACDEAKVSVIFEGMTSSIDGGLILTDAGDISDAIENL